MGKLKEIFVHDGMAMAYPSDPNKERKPNKLDNPVEPQEDEEALPVEPTEPDAGVLAKSVIPDDEQSDTDKVQAKLNARYRDQPTKEWYGSGRNARSSGALKDDK